MLLNNVYYWAKYSWKKITAEEFLRNNPDIKVSAKAKYFWCEMCGQFVTLANGDVNEPHFRHSSAELNKLCKDRSKSFDKDDWFDTPKPTHSLPIKICVEQKNFRFQIGLNRLPNQILEKVKNCRIKIKSGEKILYHNTLSDCLIEDRTTWLDIKDIPKESCSLTLEPQISEIDFYWNEKIKGVSSDGTLFDETTGKKILYDADIKVNSKYYLLVTQDISPLKGLTVKHLANKNIGGKKWRLYEVEATELSEGVAKFFLKYHCRLTATPISIVPIYPVHTQEDNIVYCDLSKMFIYFSGNAKGKIFYPPDDSRKLEKNEHLIDVDVDARKKMIAAGRSEILQYLYIWQGSSIPKFELTEVKVTDINGKIVSDEVAHILPKNSRLQITAKFDGKVITNHNNITKKNFFKSGIPFDVKDIILGMEIKIFQGLDCVWKISYQREETGISKDDTELFLKLERGGGRKIQIPHTWGSLADKLKNYPKVQSWLYKSIRFGFVSEESYLLFRQFILKAV